MIEGLQHTHHDEHDGHPATLSTHAPPNDANWPSEAAATAPHGIRLLVRRSADCCAEKGGQTVHLCVQQDDVF
jgi:hypothetical protein